MNAKRGLYGLLGCLLLVACMEQPKQETQEDSQEEKQSTLTQEQEEEFLTLADTLPLDEEMEEEPLPKTVDEVFDDFLFRFDNSNRFQRQRVHFPLPVTDAEGETHMVKRSEWKHHSMSLGQDFCTVLWNNSEQMGMKDETSLTAVSIEHIYLHSRIIETFDFKRDTLVGKWMLAAQRKVPFSHHHLNDFLDFYSNFATDSIFQRRHVHDPLRFIITSEDSEEHTIEGTIDTDQWFEFAPELPQAILVNINYGQSFSNANRMVMQMRGFSDSMQNLFVFRRDANKRWKLTEFEN